MLIKHLSKRVNVDCYLYLDASQNPDLHLYRNLDFINLFNPNDINKYRFHLYSPNTDYTKTMTNNHIILFHMFDQLNEKNKVYDYYWKWDYDVWFNGDYSIFFNCINLCDNFDLLMGDIIYLNSNLKNEIDTLLNIKNPLYRENWYWLFDEKKIKSFLPFYCLSYKFISSITNYLTDKTIEVSHSEVILPTYLMNENRKLKIYKYKNIFDDIYFKQYVQRNNIRCCYKEEFKNYVAFFDKNQLYHPVKIYDWNLK